MADAEAVRHYLGLTLDEAQRLATREGRRLTVRSPHFGRRRANHVNNRVNVLAEQGVVTRADLG